MHKKRDALSLMPIYAMVLCGFIMIALAGSRAVSTISDPISDNHYTTVIIDPGHGGEDGGASSCTGILESKLNLDISLKLNDIVHLLGYQTLLIRDADRSVYTKGETLAQKKVSDLTERVRIVNEADSPLVVSIHQNTYPNGKYWGAQVFYPNTAGSKILAEKLQTQLRSNLMPDNNRKCKQASGVYLMEHIQCTGVLVECGFISNPEEEKRLRTEQYQRELCAIIASVVSEYLSNNAI